MDRKLSVSRSVGNILHDRVQEVLETAVADNAVSELAKMDGLMQVELTSHERDVLLRGLRYVRSAIMLELRNPNPEDERRRSGQLNAIQTLSQRLESSDAMGARV